MVGRIRTSVISASLAHKLALPKEEEFGWPRRREKIPAHGEGFERRKSSFYEDSLSWIFSLRTHGPQPSHSAEAAPRDCSPTRRGCGGLPSDPSLFESHPLRKIKTASLGCFYFAGLYEGRSNPIAVRPTRYHPFRN